MSRTWTTDPQEVPAIRGSWVTGGEIPMIDTRNHIRWQAAADYGWAGARTLVIRMTVYYWRGFSGQSYPQHLTFDQDGFESEAYAVTPIAFYPQDDPSVFTVYLVDDATSGGSSMDVGIYDAIRPRQVRQIRRRMGSGGGGV